MKPRDGTLWIVSEAALEALLDRDRRYGAIRVPPRSPAADLAPALNAAYFACGCAVARLSALAGLTGAGMATYLGLPEDLVTGSVRIIVSGLAGMAGFAALGLAGERLGLAHARRRLQSLADRARRRLARTSDQAE